MKISNKLISITLVFLFLIISFSSIVFSAEVVTVNEEVSNLKEKVNLLNQKIESLENYNKILLNNIKWIFGLSITIILFIIGGFSWYSNRIKDREVENIKEKLKLEQKNKFEKIKDNIESDFEKEITNIKEKNKKIINDNIKYKTSNLEEKINILTVDFLRYKIENNDRKFPIYTFRRIVKNASDVYDRQYVIGDILKKIEKKLNDDINLEPYEEEDLNYLLGNVPKRFKSQKERIKNIINQNST